MADMLHYVEIIYSTLWSILGPVMSTTVLVCAYFKAGQPRTMLGKFKSNDACVFYQCWVHLLGNYLFSVLQWPYISENFSCTFRKWTVLWFGVMAFCSHLPSLLDCSIRTNDPSFYELFHSRSPYNLLLMIVLCTWVPLLISFNLVAFYPQDPIFQNICNAIQNIGFFARGITSLVFATITVSHLYFVSVIIIRNKKLANPVSKRLNQVTLMRQLVFLFLVLIALMSQSMTSFWGSWKTVECLFALVLLQQTIADACLVMFIPPTRIFCQKMSAYFVKFLRI